MEIKNWYREKYLDRPRNVRYIASSVNGRLIQIGYDGLWDEIQEVWIDGHSLSPSEFKNPKIQEIINSFLEFRNSESDDWTKKVFEERRIEEEKRARKDKEIIDSL